MLDRALARAVLLVPLLAATSALADDAADCAAGIAMIRGAIARAEGAGASSEPALAKLRKALRVAEREQGEREFDECLDAVGDAKRALAR